MIVMQMALMIPDVCLSLQSDKMSNQLNVKTKNTLKNIEAACIHGPTF